MYDVIIIGGGPAGLSGALVLGRCDRRVLLLDSGQYRNSSSRAMHGFLSRDGTSPMELLRIAREQLAPYPVERVEARVVRAARAPEGFSVTLMDGTEVAARKLLLATGVSDVLPELEGLAALWGKSVFVCPYCDAWELRGQTLGVHGAGGAELALSLRTWSDDVVLFTDGGEPPSADEARRLAAAGVRVVEDRVLRLVGRDGILERVELEGGRDEPRRALFLKLSQQPRSDLAEQLGLPIAGARTDTGARESTRVPGLYVAGDASRDLMFAIIAAAEGATAAFAINCELQEEDQARRERE